MAAIFAAAIFICIVMKLLNFKWNVIEIFPYDLIDNKRPTSDNP